MEYELSHGRNMEWCLTIPWYGMYSYGRTVLYMASVPGGIMRRPLCSSYFVSFVEFLVFLKIQLFFRQFTSSKLINLFY